MKIIVFGATGSIGSHLVKQALQGGHQVTAFCREPNRLSLSGEPNLTIAQGDVMKIGDVSAAMLDQEAVFIALGSGKNRKSKVRSIGTNNVLKAMKEHSTKRLICQTTLGCGESKDNLNFFWKNIMFGWFLKNVFLDHELQEKQIIASNTKWTIVRPGAFTNDGQTEDYRHGFETNDRSVKLKISRADVAHFMLNQLKTEQYLHLTPGLSY